MDVNFLRVGTESIHPVLRQQEDRGRSSIMDRCAAESGHIFHIFSSDKWKLTENCYLRVRNGALVGSVITRPSVYPSIWCQILLQPVGRMWKPTQFTMVNWALWTTAVLISISWWFFCSMQSNVLEEPALDQLLVQGIVLTRGSRKRQDTSDRVVMNQHGVWFSLDWVL